ncbi:MAG: CHASE3 domain-containing protein [Pseudomonadota bacterium]
MVKFLFWGRQAIQGVGKRLLLALAGYILLAVLAVALTNFWMNKLTSLRLEIITTRDTLFKLEKLQTNLARAEAAQSTYLLTQRPDYVDPFEARVKEVRQHVESLQDAYPRNPGQDGYRQRVNDLWAAVQADVEGKLTVMTLAVSMLATGRDDKAVEIINAGNGNKRMDDFYLHTDLLAAIERKKMDELSARNAFFLSFGRVSLTISILAVLVLIVLLVKKFVIEFARSQTSRQQLETEVVGFEQKLAERTSQLETLARDYQYDVERERHKLSRELHDELGSILTATKMDISWVMRKVRDIAPEASEKLAKTMRYLDQGIEFKRRIVNDLHPSLLSTFGLIPALQELMSAYAERTGWEMSITLPDQKAQVSEVLGLIAYRIVQESLNNASKYADATQVTVSFMVDETHLKLEISDNGKGMDSTHFSLATHGLEGMRHRVIAVGGTFKIESEPGKGMFTLAMLPLVGDVEKLATRKKLVTPFNT